MSSSTATSSERRAGRRLALALTLVAAACGGAQSGGSSSGRMASDFALRDLTGRTVRLSDYRGKVVLMNFWATWCGPCAHELPHLERIYQKYGGQGFVVLAISMDGPESSAGVGPKAASYGLSFPVLLDEETRVVGVYNPSRRAPYTVLIDRAGAIAGTREGYHPGDEAKVESEVQALVAR